ncbi:MAG: hypothetical protein IKQ18_07560 [Clostridia bacterium]|nr:hypothetical protein [Clostridia bacterium]
MKKKLSPLMIVHLILMVVQIIGCIGATAAFIGKLGEAAGGKETVGIVLNVIMMLLIMSMLTVGIVYLLMQYGKQAASFYKAFLILHISVAVMTTVIYVFFSEPNVLYITGSIIYAVKIAILLILAFWRDLGKKKTWILFYILLSLDLAILLLAIVYMAINGFNITFMGFVSALVADGTIGLSVRGKYADKDKRGTV